MPIKLFFYFFAGLALLSGIGVIVSKHLVKTMLWLLLLFISTAILWLLIHAEFLALLLGLIYIGAVLVLFLFVIMIFDLTIERIKLTWFLLLPITCTVTLVAILSHTFATAIYHKHIFTFLKHSKHNLAVTMGNLLFTDYLIEFEIIGILLLVAIVSVIGLSDKA